MASSGGYGAPLGAGSRDVEERLVDRERLDDRGELVENGADRPGDLLVPLRPRRKEHPWGQSLTAIAAGMALRTPKRRAS